jgi:hypothetical protein
VADGSRGAPPWSTASRRSANIKLAAVGLLLVLATIAVLAAVKSKRDGQANGPHLFASKITEGGGAGHCGWQDITFLFAARDRLVGTYVRDLTGEFMEITPVAFEANATLPTSAVFTGWRDGDRELWVAPAVRPDRAPDSVYIVSPDGIERWPLFPSGCM